MARALTRHGPSVVAAFVAAVLAILTILVSAPQHILDDSGLEMSRPKPASLMTLADDDAFGIVPVHTGRHADIGAKGDNCSRHCAAHEIGALPNPGYLAPPPLQVSRERAETSAPAPSWASLGLKPPPRV